MWLPSTDAGKPVIEVRGAAVTRNYPAFPVNLTPNSPTSGWRSARALDAKNVRSFAVSDFLKATLTLTKKLGYAKDKLGPEVTLIDWKNHEPAAVTELLESAMPPIKIKDKTRSSACRVSWGILMAYAPLRVLWSLWSNDHPCALEHSPTATPLSKRICLPA